MTTRPQRPADAVRLTGRGVFEGRDYFLGPYAREGTRVLLLGLPRPDGAYFERWVDAKDVKVTRRYEPRRVWDGRMYSGRTRLEYQTLGGMAEWAARQNRDRGTDRERVQCHECGSWKAAGEECRECPGC